MPAASIAMAYPVSVDVPPMRLAQTKFPALSSFETKMSYKFENKMSDSAALVRLNTPAPGSKSTVL